jgi:hypothetical protein
MKRELLLCYQRRAAVRTGWFHDAAEFDRIHSQNPVSNRPRSRQPLQNGMPPSAREASEICLSLPGTTPRRIGSRASGHDTVTLFSVFLSTMAAFTRDMAITP